MKLAEGPDVNFEKKNLEKKKILDFFSPTVFECPQKNSAQSVQLFGRL